MSARQGRAADAVNVRMTMFRGGYAAACVRLPDTWGVRAPAPRPPTLSRRVPFGRTRASAAFARPTSCDEPLLDDHDDLHQRPRRCGSSTALDDDELDGLLAYWDAANYLTVAQIYLRDNPLLREPLRAEHIKPRLLGHWGTSPGLNLVYAQLNRLIRSTGAAGALRRRARATAARRSSPTSTSRGRTRRSIRRCRADEAGLLRARAPVLDAGRDPEPRQRADARLDPRGRRARLRARARLRRRVRQPRPARRLRHRRRRGGDRAAGGLVEGHPLPRPRARRRRAADPAPQRVQDLRPDRARPRARGEICWRCCAATATTPRFVAGDDPRQRAPRLRRGARRARTPRSARSRRGARAAGARRRGRRAGRRSCCARRRAGPGPQRGRRRPGRGDLPRPPGAARRRAREPRSTSRSSRRGCAATGPRSASTRDGALVAELAALAPDGDLRMGALPARQRRPRARAAGPPRLRPPTRSTVDAPGDASAPSRRAQLGELLRDVYAAQRRGTTSASSAPTRRTPTGSAPSSRSRTACCATRAPTTSTSRPHGRVMEVLSEHNCQGWLEGYLLTGRHGLFATYEAFAMVSASMAIQHAKWLQHAARAARGARRSRR